MVQHLLSVSGGFFFVDAYFHLFSFFCRIFLTLFTTKILWFPFSLKEYSTTVLSVQLVTDLKLKIFRSSLMFAPKFTDMCVVIALDVEQVFQIWTVWIY